MSSLVTVTAPTEEPVTLDELKRHLRIVDDDDVLLQAYLTAVRLHVEQVAGVALVTQTLELALDQFPCAHYRNPFGSIYLPRPPLVSVTSVTYTDPNGAAQVMSSTLYSVDTRSTPGSVTPKPDQTWPDVQWIRNAVVVKYIAGYGASNAVPQDLRNALLVAAGMLYEYREELVDGAAPERVGLLTRLLTPYRVWTTAS